MDAAEHPDEMNQQNRTRASDKNFLHHDVHGSQVQNLLNHEEKAADGEGDQNERHRH